MNETPQTVTEAPADEPAADRKSFWGLWETRIGVLGGVVGILGFGLGLPKQVRDVLGGSTPDAAKVERARQKTALALTAPRIDVSYVFIEQNLAADDLGSPRAAHAPATAASTLRSYPILRNQVTTELQSFLDGNNRARCAGSAEVTVSVAFLIITNRGRRDATQVRVHLQQLTVDGQVPVHELPSGRNDSATQLEARAHASAPLVVDIPRTLGSGDGVRLPLFISAADAAGTKWCIVSRTAFQPRSIDFSDPTVGATATATVRPMEAPIALATGVAGRG